MIHRSMRRLSLGRTEAVSAATLPRCGTRPSGSEEPNPSSHSDSDDENFTEEETDDELYFRGPTRVPPRPTREEEKPVLTPNGKQWDSEDFGIDVRVPNGILTVLLKEFFPGIVHFKGKDEPAWTWMHYMVAPDNPGDNQTPLPSRLHRVEENFWLYFRWAEGKEQEARTVVRHCVKGLFSRLFYETRILAVLYYQRRILKVNTTRKIACRTYLTEEEYLQVEPWWFLKTENAWLELIRQRWCNPEWQAKSREHRIRKEKMTWPAHCQGSANLRRFKKKLEKKEKRVVTDLEAWGEGRKEKRDDGLFMLDERRTEMLEAYGAAYVQLYGRETDWHTSPIDPMAVHVAGGGKKHGRFMIGDGFLDSSAVHGDNSPDDPRPCRRARTNEENTNQIEDLMRQLQEEREAREREREEREQEKEHERAEREQEREREREERAREKEQERKERELEKKGFEEKSAYYDAALRAIQSKLNIHLPSVPTPLPVTSTRPDAAR